MDTNKGIESLFSWNNIASNLSHKTKFIEPNQMEIYE